jgi:hypothetical protein
MQKQKWVCLLKSSKNIFFALKKAKMHFSEKLENEVYFQKLFFDYKNSISKHNPKQKRPLVFLSLFHSNQEGLPLLITPFLI